MKGEKKHAPVRRRWREKHGHEMPLNASGLWLFVITLGSVSRGASDASSSIVIQAANPEQGRKKGRNVPARKMWGAGGHSCTAISPLLSFFAATLTSKCH